MSRFTILVYCPSTSRANIARPCRAHTIFAPARAFSAHWDAFFVFCSMTRSDSPPTTTSTNRSLAAFLCTGNFLPSNSTSACPPKIAAAQAWHEQKFNLTTL